MIGLKSMTGYDGEKALSQYQRDTFSLCRSMMIYSEEAARMSRVFYEMVTGDDVDDVDLPYHLNLQGIYGPHDTQMLIESIDTREIIPFTKASLKEHSATRAAWLTDYQYRIDLYKEYPGQVDLINGILLSPVVLDWDSFRTGTIVALDTSLINANEESLLETIQSHLYRLIDRWDNPAYAENNELYGITLMGWLYSTLPASVMAYRESKCQHREAHPYHVNTYLISQGVSPSDVAVLTENQRMAMYLGYEEWSKHRGLFPTMNAVIAALFDEIEQPIYHYHMQLTNQVADAEVTSEYVPTALGSYTMPNMLPLTLEEYSALETSLITVSDMTKSDAVFQSAPGRVPLSLLETYCDISLPETVKQYELFSLDLLGYYVNFGTNNDVLPDLTTDQFSGLSLTAMDVWMILYWYVPYLDGVPMTQYPNSLRIPRLDNGNDPTALLGYGEVGISLYNTRPKLLAGVSPTGFMHYMKTLYEYLNRVDTLSEGTALQINQIQSAVNSVYGQMDLFLSLPNTLEEYLLDRELELGLPDATEDSYDDAIRLLVSECHAKMTGYLGYSLQVERRLRSDAMLRVLLNLSGYDLTTSTTVVEVGNQGAPPLIIQ